MQHSTYTKVYQTRCIYTNERHTQHITSRSIAGGASQAPRQVLSTFAKAEWRGRRDGELMSLSRDPSPQARPQPMPFAEERLQKRRPRSAKRACVARAERREESANTSGDARKALNSTVHAAAPAQCMVEYTILCRSSRSVGAPSTASLPLPTGTLRKRLQSLPTSARRASRPRT